MIEEENSLLVFLGEFEREIRHPDLGLIRRGTLSYEYYWLDRWYNVFRFHEPNGDFRNFYCNINMPPTFDNGCLDYVDLDIDVLLWKDQQPEILDYEEYHSNAEKYAYPVEVDKRVRSSLIELSRLIGERKFPFDSNL